MSGPPLKESEVVAQVRLSWYVIALPVILAVLLSSFVGWIHPLIGVLALFGLIFWLFSLLFVLYAKFKYRKRSQP